MVANSKRNGKKDSNSLAIANPLTPPCPIEPALDGYGRWMDPEYPLVSMGYVQERKQTLAIPKGLEVIACFDGENIFSPTLLALFLSATMFEKMTEKTRSHLELQGLFPYPKIRTTLEKVLQEYDQRQAYHANPTLGVLDAHRSKNYGLMHMYNAVEYIAGIMGKKDLQFREVERAAFTAYLEQTSPMIPFHLSGNTIYYTGVQANEVQRMLLPPGTKRYDAMEQAKARRISNTIATGSYPGEPSE